MNRPVVSSTRLVSVGNWLQVVCTVPSRVEDAASHDADIRIAVHVVDRGVDHAGVHQRVGVEQQQMAARRHAERLVVGRGEARVPVIADELHRREIGLAPSRASRPEDPLSTTKTSSVACASAVEQALEAIAQHGLGVPVDDDDRQVWAGLMNVAVAAMVFSFMGELIVVEVVAGTPVLRAFDEPGAGADHEHEKAECVVPEMHGAGGDRGAGHGDDPGDAAAVPFAERLRLRRGLEHDHQDGDAARKISAGKP